MFSFPSSLRFFRQNSCSYFNINSLGLISGLLPLILNPLTVCLGGYLIT